MTELTAKDRLLWKRRFGEEYQQRIGKYSDIREQMPLLYEAVRRYDTPVVAELGVFRGNSTIALLRGASERGGHVWSVDKGPVTAPHWWESSDYWSLLVADDMGEDAAKWIPAKLDVLFIDTSHLYGHTLAELARFVPRVRPGGMVLCHDTELTRNGWPLQPDFSDKPEWGGVMGEEWARAAASGPEYPVAAALDDYCKDKGLTWERQKAPKTDEPFYGLGTIRIPDA